MKRFNQYLPFILLFICCSCTVHKDIQRISTDTKTETQTQSVVTTTTEIERDGCIETIADTLQQVTPLQQLEDGKEVITEDGNIELRTKLDPKTNTLRTMAVQKPKAIPYHEIERTFTREEKKQDQKTETKQDDKKKMVDKKPAGILGISCWWLIIIPAAAAWWKWVRPWPFKLPKSLLK